MNDTIAALATAPGQGGIAIVRMSGPESGRILGEIFQPASGKHPLKSHLLTYGHLMGEDGERVDECMAVMMYAPRSYTREDVAELQLHGGVYVARKALQLCYGAGARPAEPGEFTRRAFENGRIDLAEAEAVMGLISATGEKAARAAMRQLEGGASVFIRQAQERLYALAAGVEAALDYPEEVDEEEATRELAQGLEQVAGELEGTCDERAARILESGLRVTLCGRPNVGKSSLLNALLGEERAIVTEVAGTTRDVITGEITLGGMNVRFFDTAGLHDSGDQVERIGMERAEKALREADVVLLTLDASRPLTQEDRGLLARDYAGELLVLLNKSDLPPAVDAAEVRQLNPAAEVLTLSAVQGESLAPLKARLTAFAQGLEQSPLTQQRHLDAARRASAALREARASLENGAGLELAAVDLRQAMACLGEITGDQVEERLLDEVFGRFCVGK